MTVSTRHSAGLSRRDFLVAAGATAAAAPLMGTAMEPASAPLRPVRFGVSTYSFWQFRAEPAPIERCIDDAARMGFDGVEILQVQLMRDESNARLQGIKRQAHSLGLALCGAAQPDLEFDVDRAMLAVARRLQIGQGLGMVGRACPRQAVGRQGFEGDDPGRDGGREVLAKKGPEGRHLPELMVACRPVVEQADAKDVPIDMKLYKFPSLQEQASATWLGGGSAKAMANTAVFLKEQGRIQEVKPNYASFVTDAYVKKAMSK
jgi:hypothetical protein